MALFKTTAELELIVPVFSSLDETITLPQIELSEDFDIIPLLGQAQYTALEAAYQAAYTTNPNLSTMDANLLALLKKVRKPLANFAMARLIPKLNVQIQSGGVKQSHSENDKPAFPWAVESAISGYFQDGCKTADLLLQYLEANKATFAAWSGSTAYTEFKELFVYTTDKFQRYFNINRSRLTYTALRPIMLRVEDNIKAILTQTLFDAIKAQVTANTVSADNQKLLNYIEPAVVHLSIAQAIDEFAVEISGGGITIYDSANTDVVKNKKAAPVEMLAGIRKNAQFNGQNYLKGLEDYLNTNASSTLYTDYFASSNYANPTTEAKINQDNIGDGFVAFF